jgi:probable addiction module antidote protein
MTKEKITRWNAWEDMDSEKEVIEYLKMSLKEDSPDMLMHSIANILKSKGYANIAKKMGVSREGLYKSFSGRSKPKFDTVFRIIDSLGFRFDIAAKGS